MYLIRIIIFFLFSLSFSGLRAQIDIDSLSRETPYGPNTIKYFLKDQIKFNDTLLYPIDTLPDHFYQFDYIRQFQYKMQDLGNIGTAIRPIFYTLPTIIGKTSGFGAYDLYFKTPEKIKYYNTKSPYTSVFVVFGGSDRSIVDVNFSRNISPFWNFGFDVTIINADKQINSSGEGDKNTVSYAYDFYTSYKSKDKKYHLLANFSRLSHQVNEIGGIVPTEVDPTSNLFGYNNDAKVWLKNAKSKELMVNYHFYHQYQFSKLFQFYHELNRSNELIKFTDDQLSSEADFFNEFLISESSTYDRSKMRVFKNELGIKGGQSNIFYNFYVKHRAVKFIYKYLDPVGYNNENYGGGRLRYQLNDSTLLNLSAEYLLGGNYKFTGEFRSKFLYASYKRLKSATSFLVDSYFGNHYEWYNDFTSPIADQLKGHINIDLGKIKIRPTLSYSRISNPIFFDQTKLPAQAAGSANILSPGFDLKLKFLKSLNFDNSLIYTKINGQEADKFRIPELFINSKLYFEGELFKKVMYAQIGFDMHWQSDYFGLDYDPIVQQYFLQDDFKIPSYLLADLFVSFKVKKTRWFIKLNNILQNIEAEGYFITPYYTGQKRTLDFGINWMFFD